MRPIKIKYIIYAGYLILDIQYTIHHVNIDV